MNLFGMLNSYSKYQQQRVNDLQGYDRQSRNNSFNQPSDNSDPFGFRNFTQNKDKNIFEGTGAGQSGVQQGRNNTSENLAQQNEQGHNNLTQFGGTNVALNNNPNGSKSAFQWQGADDNSRNFGQSNADKFINWQRGLLNLSDGSKSKEADIWQGGKKDGTKNVAVGGKDRSDITQVAKGKDTWNLADAGEGKGNIRQISGDYGHNGVKGSDNDDKITQESSNSENRVSAGDGNDVINEKGDHNDIKVDAGSGNDDVNIDGNKNLVDIKAGAGDDLVNVNGNGNEGKVNLGSGDDDVQINGKGNKLDIDGGTGNNRAFFNGKAGDYHIKQNKEDGTWTVTEKGNPNGVTNLKNINELNFKNDGGDYEKYQAPDEN